MPRFEVLTPDDIDQIHRTTMRVLGEIGIDFFHDEALALFGEPS